MVMESRCCDCDWFDDSTNCCTFGPAWKEVVPDQEPCGDFIGSYDGDDE